MTKNDPVLIQPADIAEALTLLSRIPVALAQTRGAHAAWAYPVAGLILGLMSGLCGMLSLWLGLNPAMAALVALTVMVVITGAMHEDGLADTADGLWGGWDRERRLDIMKDSRIGSYGVIALCLSLIARWAALWTLFQLGAGVALAGIVASAAVSRAAMPVLMWQLPHARASGLSQSVGAPPEKTVLAAVLIALIAAVFLLWTSAFGAVIAAIIVVFGLGRIARAKIGGQTGDILGAAQQTTEIAVLMTLAS